jgi:hypothetical protein
MFIYLAFRSPGILAFCWVASLGLLPAVDAVRSTAAPVRSYLPDVLLFSLPTALWAFALVAVMAHIWRGQTARARHAWLAVSIVFAVGLEFGQLCGFIPGTFDANDILTTGLAVTIPLTRSRS